MLSPEQRKQLSHEELAWYKKTFRYAGEELRESLERLKEEMDIAIKELPALPRLLMQTICLVIDISLSIRRRLRKIMRTIFRQPKRWRDDY